MSELKVLLLFGHVPKRNRGIGSAGGNQMSAVRGERQSRHGRRCPLEGSDLRTGSRVVKSDSVRLADGEELTVWAKGDPRYPFGANNRSQFGQGIPDAGLKVPELDGLVPAAGGEGAIVGGNGHATDVGTMAA